MMDPNGGRQSRPPLLLSPAGGPMRCLTAAAAIVFEPVGWS